MYVHLGAPNSGNDLSHTSLVQVLPNYLRGLVELFVELLDGYQLPSLPLGFAPKVDQAGVAEEMRGVVAAS